MRLQLQVPITRKEEAQTISISLWGTIHSTNLLGCPLPILTSYTHRTPSSNHRPHLTNRRAPFSSHLIQLSSHRASFTNHRTSLINRRTPLSNQLVPLSSHQLQTLSRNTQQALTLGLQLSKLSRQGVRFRGAIARGLLTF